MPEVKVSSETLQSIADAARQKTNRQVDLRPAEIASEIGMIPCEVALKRTEEWTGRTIKTVTIPDGIEEIYPRMFYGCSELVITNLPETVTTIGEYAFRDCTNLALKKLPSKITVINLGTFTNCTHLELDELPDAITKIMGAWNAGAFHNSGVRFSRFPKELRSIGAYAFDSCRNLGVLYFQENLERIDALSFCNCENLRKVTFSSIPTIATNTFYSCRNLTVINVPWSEGEVAGAPWNATNATINYNYKEDANGDQDTVPL